MTRVAVIGIGGKGWSGWALKGMLPQEMTHVGAILKTPGLELAAVADIDEGLTSKYSAWMSRANEFIDWWNKWEHDHGSDKHVETISVYADYEKMLTEVKPDAVIICTPPATHMKIARNVVRYDGVKAVLLEKPVATTLDDAERVLETYRAFNIPCIVNHSRRWHLAWRCAAHIAKSWRPYHLIGTCNGDPVDAGTHMADLFNMIGPKAEHTYVNAYKPKLGKYQPYLLFELQALCEKGLIEVRGNGVDVYAYPSKETGKYRDLKEPDYSEPQIFNYPYEGFNNAAMMGCLIELRDAAEGRRKKLTSSLEDGVKALRLVKEWGYVD